MIDSVRSPSSGESEAVRSMDRLEQIVRADRGSVELSVARPHPLAVELRRAFVGHEGASSRDLSVIFVATAAAATDGNPFPMAEYAVRVMDGSALLVAVGRPPGHPTEGFHGALAAIIPDPPEAGDIVIARERAFDLLEARAREAATARSLAKHRYEMGELLLIARAMTTVRDVGALLGLILEKSRFVTGADAGSVYIVERQGASPALRFKLTQNDSAAFDSSEFTMPLSERSIAGSVALHATALNIPDVYALESSSPFRFDPTFDRRTGYFTRSSLAMPLISQRDEVIGVIQLINKKRDSSRKLQSKADVDAQVVAFDERSEELLGMLAAQAGVSLETAMLYEEIRALFEGFVGASVEAIESRDPTTSGHSRRVADLTLGLARVVERETAGPYADVSFTADELRELEYASVLHDFGKIGVREKVLVKAKKLYDERLELVRARFDYVARTIETDVLSRKVRLLESGAPRDGVEALDLELAARRADIEAAWSSVCSANEPTIMTGGDFARIEKIARESFVDLRGQLRTLLDEDELLSLSVPRGSLTPGEFDEIRSHVSHTYRFLSRIPWGKALRRVPLIAAAHHERLDGKGYPNCLLASEIPLQSKMMSIADIYDALTASDRPYKKAMPVERALALLDHNVRDGHLDAELVRMFREARVWSVANGL